MHSWYVNSRQHHGLNAHVQLECVAEFTGQPLMILTCSDIGTNPEEIERNLTKNFKMAQSWGAVLLIDEADVFMERRSTADLTRNSLVAGKGWHTAQRNPK